MAVGQGVSALQANAQSGYEAKVYKQNARMTAEQSHDAIERGRRDLQLHYRKASQLEGDQNAALAANGIDITYGSAADVRADTAMFAQEDAQAIAKGTLQEVRGFDIQGANYRSQAQAAKMRGKAAIVSGIFNMASTVLGGVQQGQARQSARPI